MTLKRSLKVIQTGTIWKLGCVSSSPSIVSMALSCIISEMKQDIGRKSWFFHTPLHLTPLFRGSSSEYCHHVWYGKTKWWGYLVVKNFDDMCNRLDTILACDRRADGQTDGGTSCHGIGRAMHTRRAVKIADIGPDFWDLFANTTGVCFMKHNGHCVPKKTCDHVFDDNLK